MIEKIECPCCGRKTLKEKNIEDICFFCGWQDVPVKDENEHSPANKRWLNLHWAKKHYHDPMCNDLLWSEQKGLKQLGYEEIPDFLKVKYSESIFDIYEKLLGIEKLKDIVSLEKGTEEDGWLYPIDYIKICYNELYSWWITLEDGITKLVSRVSGEMETEIRCSDATVFINSEGINLTHYHPDSKEIIIDIFTESFGPKIILRKLKPNRYKRKHCFFKYKIISDEKFEKRREKYMKKNYRIFSGNEILK